MRTHRSGSVAITVLSVNTLFTIASSHSTASFVSTNSKVWGIHTSTSVRGSAAQRKRPTAAPPVGLFGFGSGASSNLGTSSKATKALEDNAVFKARTDQYRKGGITASDLVKSLERDVIAKIPGVDLQDCVEAALKTIADKRKRDLLATASEGRAIGVAGVSIAASVTSRGRGDVTVGGRRAQYVMQQRVQRISSGKTTILDGAEVGKEGTPLKFKIAGRSTAAVVTEEVANLERVRATNGAGACSRYFVDFVEYVEDYNGRGDVVMIMRAEKVDMRKLAESTGGGLPSGKLRKYAAEMFSIVRCLNKAGLVWTDLKLDNLVLCKGDEVKAIDLGTAVPAGSGPKAFTPASLPPDISAASRGGFGGVMVDRSYDVWGLGMAILHLYMGRSYFNGRSDPQIMADIGRDGFAVDLSGVRDGRLQDLLRGLLDPDPKKRVRYFDSPLTRLALL